MSFEDLPEDWPERPLTDPVFVSDVLDLLVSERSRAEGTLHILLCDPDDRLVQPIVIDTLDPSAGLDERIRMLRVFLAVGEDAIPGGALMLAIARPRNPSATPDDDLWARAARAAVTSWRLLGVHVVTLEGSRAVPELSSAG